MCRTILTESNFQIQFWQWHSQPNEDLVLHRRNQFQPPKTKLKPEVVGYKEIRLCHFISRIQSYTNKSSKEIISSGSHCGIKHGGRHARQRSAFSYLPWKDWDVIKSSIKVYKTKHVKGLYFLCNMENTKHGTITIHTFDLDMREGSNPDSHITSMTAWSTWT